MKCSLQILSFHKEIPGLIISFKNVKLSLKDSILIVFKLLESYTFVLTLEAITIVAANCKTSFIRESSVTYNALSERFKMVDKRKTVAFFKILFIHKLSHKELLY